ncbi:MAG: hypothetical protein QM756_02645 [Polyangiaceae bacterium]
MNAHGWLAASVLVVACGNPEARQLGPDRAAGQAEFEALLARYGPLETLAGSGLTGDDSNDWDAAAEGGPALLADLSTPHNALGDAYGNTYIADKEAHAIRKVAPNGNIATVAGVNAPGDDGDEPRLGRDAHLNWPNGIWLGPDGVVYILDLGNQKIRKLAPKGQLTTLFSVPGLVGGRGLWVADDESLAYVCSGTSVISWTPNGGVTTFADSFIDLGNLAVSASGIVYVTDRGAHQVLRLGGSERVVVAGDGTATAAVDGAPAFETSLDEVRGIWSLPSGAFFLATHAGSQVFYLDTYGLLHLFIDGAHDAHAGDGEPVTSPGKKVSEVRNVTVTHKGDVLVTENDLGYVRIVRALATP